MMFAGGGLFLSMVATTIWISGDVSRMREQELAKRQAECSAPATTGTPTGADPSAAVPATGDGGFGVSADGAAADAATPAQCADSTADGAGRSSGTTAIDPNTGQPIDTYSDPSAYAADGYADPAASGGYADPNAAGGYVDPNATGGYSDPSGGYSDPSYDQAQPIDPASSGF